ncbi:hypothetical protein GOBAR_AA38975 [Gossypium barbadense]|uniref:Uncharacterized protein n=1 Tax=Gossypium barbadense TaxID=3634 RepID=A0A2P5VSB1_GOSBA|nr:hypothetical protein GOBAR_AA38975 [Gossypium barbadense]
MVRWHPTMDILFSCSYDNTAKVWWSEDADGGWDCVQTLGESSKFLSTSLWSVVTRPPFGRLLLMLRETNCDDLTLKLWEADIIRMQSGEGYAWNHLCILSGFHDRTIFSVHWSSFNLKPIVYGLRPLQEGIIDSGAADDAVRLFVESKDGLMNGPPSYQLPLKKEKAQDNGALGISLCLFSGEYCFQNWYLRLIERIMLTNRKLILTMWYLSRASTLANNFVLAIIENNRKNVYLLLQEQGVRAGNFVLIRIP